MITHVTLFYGYMVTKSDLDKVSDKIKEWFDGDRPEEFGYYLKNRKTEVHIGSVVMRYGYCHCEKTDDDENMLIGMPIKKYYRVNERCEKCRKSWFCCDDCFNITENGVYDIKKAAKEITEIDKSMICENCHHHKRSSGRCEHCKFRIYECDRATCRLPHPRLIESPFPIKPTEQNCKYYIITD